MAMAIAITINVSINSRDRFRLGVVVINSFFSKIHHSQFPKHPQPAPSAGIIHPV